MTIRYKIEYRSSEHPGAGWLPMSAIFFTFAGAMARKNELEDEFCDKEWRITPTDQNEPYIGNSGTH